MTKIKQACEETVSNSGQVIQRLLVRIRGKITFSHRLFYVFAVLVATPSCLPLTVAASLTLSSLLMNFKLGSYANYQLHLTDWDSNHIVGFVETFGFGKQMKQGWVITNK